MPVVERGVSWWHACSSNPSLPHGTRGEDIHRRMRAGMACWGTGFGHSHPHAGLVVLPGGGGAGSPGRKALLMETRNFLFWKKKRKNQQQQQKKTESGNEPGGYHGNPSQSRAAAGGTATASPGLRQRCRQEREPTALSLGGGHRTGTWPSISPGPGGKREKGCWMEVAHRDGEVLGAGTQPRYRSRGHQPSA